MSGRDIFFGAQFFRTLRENNYVYIDKTGFISEFLSGDGAKVSVITRPRRFGKSLLLDMLREFFDQTKDSREIFDGLAVSEEKELCEEWMNKYPVIYLSLNKIKGDSFDITYNRFQRIISELYKEHLYLLDSNKLNSFDKEDMLSIIKRTCDSGLLVFSIKMLCEAIYQDCGIKPIILIDEYDAPFEKIEGEEDYKKMASFLDHFFEISLKNNEYFEFAILTGCLPYTTEGITTGFNNYVSYDINDLSFADKFGFTQSEVQSLLAEQGLSDKMDMLQEWYDGYCFGDSHPVYCPCDVMEYICDLKTFSETEPQAYWYNIGSHNLVRTFIDKLNVLHLGKGIATLLQGGIVT
ncbi:MAG: AAA family ATPase, partial [Desulfovibrionaceae bacterium]|nr:AAA family ATPase [Desulfovibrionaceae bacterium]